MNMHSMLTGDETGFRYVIILVFHQFNKFKEFKSILKVHCSTATSNVGHLNRENTEFAFSVAIVRPRTVALFMKIPVCDANQFNYLIQLVQVVNRQRLTAENEEMTK